MLLFSDITFWLVFIFFLAIYAFIRRCSRMGMVLYVAAFSLLFFYLANGWLMVLLPAVALVAWWAGRLLATMQRESGGAVYHCWKDRLVLTLAILIILLPLLYFKYLATSVCSMWRYLSASPSSPFRPSVMWSMSIAAGSRCRSLCWSSSSISRFSPCFWQDPLPEPMSCCLRFANLVQFPSGVSIWVCGL